MPATARPPKPVTTIDRDGAPVLEDVGCSYWHRCTTCPLRPCIAELPSKERREFISAWRTVLLYVAQPDGEIEL